ncbi:unnamed protein product [Darwinula stevensoni]|uniref:Uncharacterized protein n=1 Tax=Darwinula stevensoni TaxID=69355 RepID=A0A7R9A8U1_9CRUS|nr:unnamed protein product [Darwinula stevensoni]CAG0896784.1 unnamed protein product [Darwinula stevensoni]
MAYTNALRDGFETIFDVCIASVMCHSSPPYLMDQTMNFSYGWDGSLPAPVFSEASYDCPRYSRCPPLVPIRAKCTDLNYWEFQDFNVSSLCSGNPRDYVYSSYDGLSYKRYPGPLNRTAASQVCCRDGARLASDTSYNTFKSIRLVAPDTTEAILQGATDEDEEGTWIYEDTSWFRAQCVKAPCNVTSSLPRSLLSGIPVYHDILEIFSPQMKFRGSSDLRFPRQWNTEMHLLELGGTNS